MTLFTFFVIIPIINILLLAVNFILAPHKPYKEKKTPFECGYHSFLLQNRTQFTISFFLFGLLFLMFDIEIVIIYPITVSSYFNATFGISVVVIFVLILALGFVFELGKGALKIDSKQGRIHLHSSLIPTCPTLLYLHALVQTILAFIDLYRKLTFFNIMLTIGVSTAFKSIYSLISFIVCSSYCLNLSEYNTFGFFVSTLLLVLYGYILDQKSGFDNFFYNTVTLLLRLFILFTFWYIVSMFISGAFIIAGAIFSNLILSDCIDPEGDFDNPFIQSVILGVYTWHFDFADDILYMQNGSSDGGNVAGNTDNLGNSGGAGDPNSGGPDGGGPGPDYIAEAAAAATASASASEADEMEIDESEPDITGHEVRPVDSNKLGDLKHDEQLRASVHTEIEETNSGGHRIESLSSNALLDHEQIGNSFLDEKSATENMKNVEAEVESEVQQAKAECETYKNRILEEPSISPEDKAPLIENLEANLDKTDEKFRETVNTTASKVARDFDPDYEGYLNASGNYVDKYGKTLSELPYTNGTEAISNDMNRMAIDSNDGTENGSENGMERGSDHVNGMGVDSGHVNGIERGSGHVNGIERGSGHVNGIEGDSDDVNGVEMASDENGSNSG